MNLRPEMMKETVCDQVEGDGRSVEGLIIKINCDHLPRSVRGGGDVREELNPEQVRPLKLKMTFPRLL